MLAMSANGLVLATLFMTLQEPDVSFSPSTVGMAAVPLLFPVVLSSIRIDRCPGAPGLEGHNGDN